MVFLPFAIVSCLAISALGAPNSLDLKIVNGNTTTPSEFPFVAELRLNGFFRCGAFVYNQNYAVTSAICVYGYSSDNFQIVAGQWDRDVTESTEQIRYVTAVKIHEMFQPNNYKNNIALLRLSSPLSLGTSVDSVPIGAEQRPGEATLTGWGNSGSGAAEAQLKKVTVVLDPSDNCNPYGPLFDSDLMLCAGKGSDACQGDAGSPLFQLSTVDTVPPADSTINTETTEAIVPTEDPLSTTDGQVTDVTDGIITEPFPIPTGVRFLGTGVVIGIVSHNEACNNPLYPTVFTKLSAYALWLLTNAGPQF